MAEIDQLREQVRTQEMEILRLRASCGNQAARIANFQRIIATLEFALAAERRQTIRQAEALFEGRT